MSSHVDPFARFRRNRVKDVPLSLLGSRNNRVVSSFAEEGLIPVRSKSKPEFYLIAANKAFVPHRNLHTWLHTCLGDYQKSARLVPVNVCCLLQRRTFNIALSAKLKRPTKSTATCQDL